MKRKNIFIISLSLICAVAVFGLFTACNNKGDGILPSPDGLKIDDYLLTWNKIDGATEYCLDINGNEFITKDNEYDLFNLIQEKNYIKVMARGDLKENFDSDWSETIVYDIELASFYFRETIDETVCEISGLNSEHVKGKLVVPATIYGKTVKVGKTAFANCENITDVIFLGESTQIKAAAFLGCTNLKRVVLPKYLEVIAGSMFSNCQKLSAIEIPESVTDICSSAFLGCTSLEKITLPDCLRKIDVTAFAYCTSLKQIVLPDSLQEIGAAAFSGSGIEKVYIPKNVEEIGSNSFDSCKNLSQITVDQNNASYKSESDCLIRKSDDTLISTCKESVLPNTLKHIGNCAFKGMSFSKITIPEGVTTIGDYAFLQCEGKPEITIPSTVTDISYIQALPDCSICVDPNNTVYKSEGNCIIRKSDGVLILGCPSSVIPDTVKIIGDSAFKDTNVTEILIPSSVETIGGSAFSSCGKLKNVTFSDGLIKIGSNAFYGCGYLEQIVIPKSVKEICDGAFLDCMAIFIVPDSVETIGNAAFGKNNSLFTTNTFPSVIFTDARSIRREGWAKQIVKGQGVIIEAWNGISDYYSYCDFGYDGETPYVKSFVLVKTLDAEANIAPSIKSHTSEDFRNLTCAPLRKGYNFVGWATDENGTDIVSETSTFTDENGNIHVSVIFESAKISENTRLYAVWEKQT